MQSYVYTVLHFIAILHIYIVLRFIDTVSNELSQPITNKNGNEKKCIFPLSSRTFVLTMTKQKKNCSWKLILYCISSFKTDVFPLNIGWHAILSGSSFDFQSEKTEYYNALLHLIKWQGTYMKCELGSTNRILSCCLFNRVTMYVTMKGEPVSINDFYLQYLSFNTGFFLCFFFMDSGEFLMILYHNYITIQLISLASLIS